MDGQQVLSALEHEPGGRALRDLDGGEAMLVGGAVRDLARGRRPRELDVIVPAEAEEFAGRLAELIDGSQLTAHGRFGTATVRWPEGRVDVAARRAETYSAPGALPDVRPGSTEEDLRRRDFTVNAIAVGLTDGDVHAAPHALEDLAAGRLRVLHDASFLDDPTRLLRLARYAARLGFTIEPATGQLARQAVEQGALSTLSGARAGAELRLALEEADPLAALLAMDDLGLPAALGLTSPLPERQATDALSLLPDDGRPGELLMALLTDDAALLDRLEFPAPERDRIVASAGRAQEIAATLAAEQRPSRLHEALSSATPETVALAGARDGAARETAVRWLTSLRHVRLAITGDDLLAAGIPAGPELGRRLSQALALKLDGQLADGREAELAAAIGEPAS